MNSLSSPSDTPFFGSAQFRGASSSKRNSGTVLQQEEEKSAGIVETSSRKKKGKSTDPKVSRAVASVQLPFRWIFPEVLHVKLGEEFHSSLQLKAGSEVRTLSGKVVLGEKIDNEDHTLRSIYHYSCLILKEMDQIESSTFPSRTRKSFNPNTIATAEMESSKINEKLQKLRASAPSQLAWNEVQTYVQKILKTKCGNCEELALAFIAIFRVLDLNLSIEHCPYNQGDHAVVIINRKSHVCSKTVIVDPWGRSIYTYEKRELPFTYIGRLCYMNSDKKAVACPIVEPYDIRKGVTLFPFEKERPKPRD